jgi:hypothetical protein
MNWENKKNNISGRSKLFVSPTTAYWRAVVKIEDYRWKKSKGKHLRSKGTCQKMLLNYY